MLISALTPVLAFLKRVPWFVWVALALLALWAFDRSAQYREGYREGAESVKAELRAAEAEAAKRSLEGIAEADAGKAERAEKEAEIVGGMIDRIEEAEAQGENPLDALF